MGFQKWKMDVTLRRLLTAIISAIVLSGVPAAYSADDAGHPIWNGTIKTVVFVPKKVVQGTKWVGKKTGLNYVAAKADDGVKKVSHAVNPYNGALSFGLNVVGVATLLTAISKTKGN